MVWKWNITLTVGVGPPPLNPLRLPHSVYFPSNCVSLFLHCPSPCLPTPHFSLHDHTLFPSLWSSPSLQNLSDWRSLSNLPCALARPAPPNGPSLPAPTVLVIPKQQKKKEKSTNHSQPTLLCNQKSQVTRIKVHSLVCRVLLTGVPHKTLTVLFFLWV